MQVENVKKIGNGKPYIAFVGGTHGDELTGIEVVKKMESFLEEKEIVKGTVFLIIANPEAVKQKKRFIDEDLNRVFHLNFSDPEAVKNINWWGGESPNNLKPKKKLNYERKRALDLSEILSMQDFVFDIHSTIQKGKSFVLLFDEKKQKKLAELFKPDFLVSTEKIFGKHRERSKIFTIDRFVSLHGGVGITIETGWKEDVSKVEKVFSSCKEILDFLEVTEPKNRQQSLFDMPSPSDDSEVKLAQKRSITPLVEVYEEKISCTGYFHWSQSWKNLEKIPKGTVIGTDGDRKMVLEKDSFIIFPKVNPTKGGRICLLGA